ncbi:sialidase-like, partial [Acanthaster planci]|uniref:Sialidase-like n=1 Tax=Acanthaster planci TaxID=133434 RepID=A0A8B7XIH4_ACAPL
MAFFWFFRLTFLLWLSALVNHSGTQTTQLSSPTSSTQTTQLSSPTSGTQTTPLSSPTSGTQTTPVSSPTSGTQTTVTSATATINTSSFHETTAVKTTSSLSDRTTVSLTAEVTTHSETTAATNLHGTTVVTTKEGCGLSEDSCTTNGVFLKESCECLCKKGFAGVICEVSTEKNPCTENPDLCQERGQYCESDTKITDGKEYVCKCNSLEGYVEKDGKCIEEEPFTTKLDVTIIDGKEATYKPAHRDINSAESRKVLDAVIPV